MQRTGIVNLPLHSGHCPRWLFPRMVNLSREIAKTIIYEFSPDNFLERLANPYFFQALGCVIGFDWHSSGLTTTTCAALKEALNHGDFGVKLAGGKGSVSNKIFEEAQRLHAPNIDELVYASRTSAKVDNALVQDGYHLYHHVVAFSEYSSWTVIQQGLNPESRYARRYHWLSTREAKLDDFIEEPHKAICYWIKGETLNLTSIHSRDARKISLDLVKDNPEHLKRYFSRQATLLDFHLPRYHKIPEMNKRNIKSLLRAYEVQPRTYEELVTLRGIGPKTLRALALISMIIYGAELSWQDPADFSFAHGGKDGVPYPVDRILMDETTQLLTRAVDEARIGERERLHALNRLRFFFQTEDT
ncbi:DUF763 domain-containing protein [[Eubacterium] cellulosolvens]